MLATINNVTILQPDPGGELERWLAAHWPELETQLQEVARNNQPRQGGYGGYFGPGWRETPIVKLNSLYWPTGGSRFPFGCFLADEASRNNMYRFGGSSQDNYVSAILRLGNVDTEAAAITIVMMLLHSIPLVGAPSATPLWLVPLIGNPGVCNEQEPYYPGFNWTGSAEATPIPEYHAFDREAIGGGRFVPEEFIDVMGWSHQRRGCREIRGSSDSYVARLVWRTADESRTTLDDQIEDFKGLKLSGGVVNDGAVHQQVRFMHPAFFDYHRAQITGRTGNGPRSQWPSDNIPAGEFYEGNGFEYTYTPSTSRPKTMGSMRINCRFPRRIVLGSLTNATDVTDFHAQWLADYLIWTSRYCTIEYGGIVPWQSTGFDDYTLWECWPEPKTRVVGLPPSIRCGINLAGYEVNENTSHDMPDIVTGYCSFWSGYNYAAYGSFYLTRSGTGPYTYSREVLQPSDPDKLLPNLPTEDFQVTLAWEYDFAQAALRWRIIQIQHDTAKVVRQSALGFVSIGSTCVVDYNKRYDIKAPIGFVEPADVTVFPGESFGQQAQSCSGTSGGGSPGCELGTYDPGPGWSSVGSYGSYAQAFTNFSASSPPASPPSGSWSVISGTYPFSWEAVDCNWLARGAIAPP